MTAVQPVPRRRRRSGRRDFGSVKSHGTASDPRFSVTWWEGGRQRRKRGFENRGDAEKFLAKVRVELDNGTREAGAPVTPLEVTVATAIEGYEKYRREKGNKEHALAATTCRLGTFFTDGEVLLVDLTPAKCATYYEALRTRRQPGRLKACLKAAAKRKEPSWPADHEVGVPGCRCRPYATDTHRNTLAEAKSLLKWAVQVKRWLQRNPLEGIEGKGKRRHGKPQLRIDEARRWTARAVELADKGESGAVAAMMALLLGMRASEIVSRVVRDLDDEGRLLWIPDSKTEAGRRTLRVPDLLQPHLRALAEGKAGGAPIFGLHWRDWPREWVERICKLAGVPKVSAHSMRGLHSTLAMEAGVTGAVVAASLGHESVATTTQSYAKPEAVAAAQQRRALTVLEGGRTV
jgi:integrase